MSLRGKLLALFAVFGVLPVVALGVYGYVRSLESVEDLIRERTAIDGADEVDPELDLRGIIVRETAMSATCSSRTANG